MTELRAEHLGSSGLGRRSTAKISIRDGFGRAYLAALASKPAANRRRPPHPIFG
jgi:hypothetical protein